MLGVAVTVAVPLLAACDAANQGAWAAADEPRGAVLVIYENRDLTDHIRSVALHLAASGYSVLAVVLLSEQEGTASFADDAEVTAALNNVPDSRFRSTARCPTAPTLPAPPMPRSLASTPSMTNG